MYLIECRNVNHAYNSLTRMVMSRGVAEDSRNGKVVSLQQPLSLRINNPWERVLTADGRNENPCFHLFEALYFLAGRNDTKFISQFNPRMMEFSDDGNTFNGVYGYRWKTHFGYDQIERAVGILKKDPTSRRVVISMWDPHEDLGSGSKDIPCHQQIMPRIVGGKLNILTTNRSNDLIWGLCGSNAVHLSLLHEYLACSLGVKVGIWWSVTNNLHIYERHWDMAKGVVANPHLGWLPYAKETTIENPKDFVADCVDFCNGQVDDFRTPFFDGTVAPLIQGWHEWDDRDFDAAEYNISCAESAHWRSAFLRWLRRNKI